MTSNDGSTPEGDALLRGLRDLPVHSVSTAPGRSPAAAARAAFVQAFEDEPRLFDSIGRAAMPVALASVVGLYLVWAFATAIALNR